MRSSGNQAERAVRVTAEKNKDKYPKVYDVICKDTYVDDVISGTHSEEEGLMVTDQLKLCMWTGDFYLKGLSVSGKDPDAKLSADKESVSVGGLKWFPKGDYLMVNVGKLNFSRKVRGRKSESSNDIPEDLTMRDCVGKVAEFFEPFGKLTPIVAGWKLDISYLHKSGLTWDDKLPDNLRSVWVSNFEMMEEIGR